MNYMVPLRDMRFVLHESFDVCGYSERLGYALDRETIDGVLEEAARFTAQLVASLNRNSDEQGCHLYDGEVTHTMDFATRIGNLSKTAGRA